MNYNELIEIYRNHKTDTDNISNSANAAVIKILSPCPLENLEELEQIISSRFRYTGPGKWVKIIRESVKTNFNKT